MSRPSLRREVASPRNAELPYAFTFGEFARGAFLAWLWFQPCVLMAGAILGPVFYRDATSAAMGLGLVFFGLPFTVGATLAGSPIACLLGHLLRRQRHRSAHLIAFGAYGLVLGASLPLLVLGSMDSAFLSFAAVYAAAGAIALPLGWWVTSRRALRDDGEGAIKPKNAPQKVA